MYLNHAEHHQVGGDGRDGPGLAGLARGAVDAAGEVVVDDRRAGQEGDEAPVGGAVEEPAGGDHEQAPADAAGHQQPADRQHDSEEGSEGECGEEHQVAPADAGGHVTGGGRTGASGHVVVGGVW